MPPGKDEIMRGVDTTWLRMDRPDNLMIVTAMVILESLSADAFRALVRDRFLRFSRFRQRPVRRKGRYFWRDCPDLDLAYHVERVKLPGPADRHALQAFVGDQMSRSLDQDKPLWKFYLVEDYQGNSALVMRIHHCYADGLSMMAVFSAMTDNDELAMAESRGYPASAGAGVYPLQEYLDGVERLAGRVRSWVRGGAGLLKESLVAVSLHKRLPPGLMAGLNGASELSRLALMPRDSDTRLRGKVGGVKCCAWSEPIPLEAIKLAGRQSGCTVNDVLLATLSGSLGGYLRQGCEVSPETMVRAVIPVNMRPLATEKQRRGLRKLGNCFGTVLMRLPVGIDNPVERLFRVKHEMMDIKHSIQPALSYGMLFFLGALPGGIQREVLDLFTDKSTLVLSNVPGPTGPCYLGGRQIHEQLFWVPQSGGIGMGASIISYNGSVQFGLVTDRQLVPDPVPIVEGFGREFRRLARTMKQVDLAVQQVDVD